MKKYLTSYTAVRNAAVVSTAAMALILNLHDMVGLAWLTVVVHLAIPLSAGLWTVVIAMRYLQDQRRNCHPDLGRRELERRGVMNVAVVATTSICYVLTLMAVASIVGMTGGDPVIVQAFNWIAVGGVCLMAAGSLVLAWFGLRLGLARRTQAAP